MPALLRSHFKTAPSWFKLEDLTSLLVAYNHHFTYNDYAATLFSIPLYILLTQQYKHPWERSQFRHLSSRDHGDKKLYLLEKPSKSATYSMLSTSVNAQVWAVGSWRTNYNNFSWRGGSDQSLFIPLTHNLVCVLGLNLTYCQLLTQQLYHPNSLTGWGKNIRWKNIVD